MSAPWSTVEALLNDPAFLGDVETAFAEEDEKRAEREAIRSEAAGVVQGVQPPVFTCPRTDRWTKNPGGVPRATIPPWPDLDPSADHSEEPLRAVFARLPKPCLNDAEALYVYGDGKGPHQEQAKALGELGLMVKANRHAWCRRSARIKQCRKAGHRFKVTFRCMLRYCRDCAPRIFHKLFAKYVMLEPLVKKRPGWVLAKLDFMLANSGELPDAETIRKMNQSVRKVMRPILRKKKDAFYLWCDELGWKNTNAHVHGIYYGPYVPQEKLSQAWEKVTGDSRIVWIESAKEGFRQALYHLLKYISKPPSDDPQDLAWLEKAFDKVRRIHLLGAAYNHPLTKNQQSEPGCPLCGSELVGVTPYLPIDHPDFAGLRELEDVESEIWERTPRGRSP